MKIISFAWTTPALLAGKKTVTRRAWTADYAKKFKDGDFVSAYDKSPRFKGKKVATIKILSIRKEPLNAITDSDVTREGYDGMTAKEFVDRWTSQEEIPPDTPVYRIEFEVIRKESK